MWKDIIFVAGSAALGEFISRKWGAQIEAKAIEMKVPAAAAHAAVVGGAAAGSFFALKALL